MANPAKLEQRNNKKRKTRRASKAPQQRRSKARSDKRRLPMRFCWQARSAKAWQMPAAQEAAVGRILVAQGVAGQEASAPEAGPAAVARRHSRARAA